MFNLNNEELNCISRQITYEVLDFDIKLKNSCGGCKGDCKSNNGSNGGCDNCQNSCSNYTK